MWPFRGREENGARLSPAPRPCRFGPLPAKLPVVMSQLRMRWLTIVQNRNSAIVPPSRKHDISFFSFFCFIFPNPWQVIILKQFLFIPFLI